MIGSNPVLQLMPVVTRTAPCHQQFPKALFPNPPPKTNSSEALFEAQLCQMTVDVLMRIDESVSDEVSAQQRGYWGFA